AIRLQHATAGLEPGVGELVVGGEAAELVPVVVDTVDEAVVGPEQLVTELKVIRRIGGDEIDADLRQRAEDLDAIADDDLVERELGAHAFLVLHAHHRYSRLMQRYKGRNAADLR